MVFSYSFDDKTGLSFTGIIFDGIDYVSGDIYLEK
jgi:hypothetical protein